LRHTLRLRSGQAFGRQLTEAQVPVTTTQRLLGHSQLKTTQLYTHLSNRQAQAEYEAAMAQINGWLGLEQASYVTLSDQRERRVYQVALATNVADSSLRCASFRMTMRTPVVFLKSIETSEVSRAGRGGQQ
jgi:hypothetical protein